MNSNRFNFTQPYWEFAFPLLSWLFMLPLLVWSEPLFKEDFYVLGLSTVLSGLISSKFSLYVVSSFSIMFLSWSIGVTVSEHELLRKRNYFPAGVAAFFGSLSILTLGFSFSYVAVIFFILALKSLMCVKRESRSFNHLFNSGFLLALGCLIDSRVWLTFLFLFLGILMLRKFSIRDVFILVASVLNVLFLAGCAYLLITDSFPNVFLLLSYSKEWYTKLMDVNFIYASYISVGLLGIIGLGFSESYIAVLNNSEKRRFRILMYFSLLSFVISSVLSYSYVGNIETSFLIAPLAIAVTIYATYIKNKWLRAILELFLASLIIIWVWLFFK